LKNCIVIIPTYNEAENAPKIVDAVFRQSDDVHVLIVDDNSPDGTATFIKALIPVNNGRLHILERQGKQGLGTAYIAGFKWSLQNGYDYIIEMDADFSHPPEKLVELYDACAIGKADVAVGSRYTRGGSVKNWPLGRILMSYFASVYVRIITFMPVSDTTAGFVCYTRKVLEQLQLDKIQFVGYAFQIEMKYAAWIRGFKIVEVPITFTDRREGVSKMTKGIFNEAVYGVLKLRKKYRAA
jgi:dolichol-phosphate mannosyltransferase